MRSDGQEGFIPSGFVYPAENILQNQDKNAVLNNANVNLNNNNPFPAINVNNNTNSANLEEVANQAMADGLARQQQQPSQQQIIGADDLRYHGTELVMLYDYKVRKFSKCGNFKSVSN